MSNAAVALTHLDIFSRSSGSRSPSPPPKSKNGDKEKSRDHDAESDKPKTKDGEHKADDKDNNKAGEDARPMEVDTAKKLEAPEVRDGLA